MRWTAVHRAHGQLIRSAAVLEIHIFPRVQSVNGDALQIVVSLNMAVFGAIGIGGANHLNIQTTVGLRAASDLQFVAVGGGGTIEDGVAAR